MSIVRHLIVDQFGAHIGKYSERLKVTKKGELLVQAPLIHLESVVIANQGVSISAESIRVCTERGIPIHFISGTGTPYASLYSAGLTGTAATRRAQLDAYRALSGLRFALSISIGKLQNQSNFLKYIAKYRKDIDLSLFEELRLRSDEILDSILEIAKIREYPEFQEGIVSVDDFRFEIMGAEGRAAQRYWGAIQLVLPRKYLFPGRKGRGARDPINSALNYGYGILYAQCERALVLAGLDPYAGFLHVDRPGKPSLTLDFIEEFRVPIVDKAIIGMANKGVNFEQDANGMLKKNTRRVIAEKIQQRLDSRAVYEGKRYSMASIIQKQARHLATFFRGERLSYDAFRMNW